MLKSCICSLFSGMYADMWNQQLQNKSNEFIETDQEKIEGDKTVATYTHRNHH